MVANSIMIVIRDESWRERRIRTGEIVQCRSFLELLTAPPLKGFGEDPKRVEALLKDEPDALRMYREATTEKPGGDRQSKDAKALVTMLLMVSQSVATPAHTP